MALLCTALQEALIYKYWTSYRTIHFVYVLMLFELLHSPAYMFLQTNHPSTHAIFPVFHKIISLSAHKPTYSTVFNCILRFFDRNVNQMKFFLSSLRIRIQLDLQAVGFTQVNALQYSHRATPLCYSMVTKTTPNLFQPPSISQTGHLTWDFQKQIF